VDLQSRALISRKAIPDTIHASKPRKGMASWIMIDMRAPMPAMSELLTRSGFAADMLSRQVWAALAENSDSLVIRLVVLQCEDRQPSALSHQAARHVARCVVTCVDMDWLVLTLWSRRKVSRGTGENYGCIRALREREVCVLGRKRLRELGPSWPSG
jgi:hypothetical protein